MSGGVITNGSSNQENAADIKCQVALLRMDHQIRRMQRKSNVRWRYYEWIIKSGECSGYQMSGGVITNGSSKQAYATDIQCQETLLRIDHPFNEAYIQC